MKYSLRSVALTVFCGFFLVVGCGNSKKPPLVTTFDIFSPDLPVVSGRDWATSYTSYSIAVRRYRDSDGDGIGDLQGIREKIAYLKNLGVGTVVLDPIQPSALLDGTRALSAFDGVAAELGTAADFDQLVQALHDAGMKLVLTLPVNHTDTAHPWFTAAVAAPDGEPGSWYRLSATTSSCSDLASSGPNPYTGSRSEKISGSTKYYYHRFAPSSPDLNLNYQPTVDAIKTAISGWLDAGVDGIYFPYAYAWMETGTTCDNLDASRALLADFASLIHDHSATTALFVSPNYPLQAQRLNDPVRIDQFMAAADAVIDDDQTSFMTGSIAAIESPSAYLDYLVKLDENEALAKTVVLTGHSERPRATASAGNDRSLYRLLLNIAYSTPSRPGLFYGDELGIGEADATATDFRESAMPFMPWTSSAPTFGFSDGTPQFTVPLLADRRNAGIEVIDEGSLANWTRRLTALRYNVSALAGGDFTRLTARDQATLSPLNNVMIWQRQTTDSTVIVVHNPTRDPVDLSLAVANTNWATNSSVTDLLDDQFTTASFAGEADPTLRFSVGAISSRWLTVLPEAAAP